MSSTPALRSSGLALTAAQLSTIKRTIANDTNDTEFSLFMAVAERTNLDPFRKHILPVVYNKDKPDKRRMSIIVTQDGQRVIARRCGDYRPSSEPTEYLIDPALKSDLNPLGIDYARVRLWQQDKQGAWWPVIGEAYWSEFAPIADEWAWDDQAQKRKPTGKRVLDSGGNWAKMPRVMIQKCATMQALRAGWPEEYAGLVDEAEMDRVRFQERQADLTAAEIVHAADADERIKRIGGGKDALMVQFDPSDALSRIPIGQFADKVLAWLRDCDGPAALADFKHRNKATLQEFWARSPADALELKRSIEAADARMRAEDGEPNLMAAG